jgi:O-antigen/teichoic acid export membrane protein
MDIGVVALVPRDVAFAAGQGHGADSDQVRTLVGRTFGVVSWQVPCVGLAALVTWMLLPSAWTLLRGPLGVVLVAFVVLFPLRLFPAILQGLQDLAFLGAAQLAGLLAGTATTVLSVRAGLGLYSLAFGWIAAQSVPSLAALWRVRTAHRVVWPVARVRLAWDRVRGQLSRGIWISLEQIAQTLVTGTDLLVVGTVIGPEAAVVYSCTGKLVALLANQPQLVLLTALPAMSELRGAAARDRLHQVSRSMAQLLLLSSGAIVVAVLVANQGFVTWWVGGSRYGGLRLTGVLVAGMLVRHVNFAAVYTLFCFGNERRLALTAMADGAAAGAAMLVLVPQLGPEGAAIGLLLATVTISLPANLRQLGRELGIRPLSYLAFWRGWTLRFAALASCAAGVALAMSPGLVPAAVATACIVVLYGGVMWPELARAPLGPMLAERLGPWLAARVRPSRPLIGSSSSESRV